MNKRKRTDLILPVLLAILLTLQFLLCQQPAFALNHQEAETPAGEDQPETAEDSQEEEEEREELDSEDEEDHKNEEDNDNENENPEPEKPEVQNPKPDTADNNHQVDESSTPPPSEENHREDAEDKEEDNSPREHTLLVTLIYEKEGDTDTLLPPALVEREILTTSNNYISLNFHKYADAAYRPYQYEYENQGLMPYEYGLTDQIFSDLYLTEDGAITIYYHNPLASPNEILPEIPDLSDQLNQSPASTERFTYDPIYEGDTLVSGTAQQGSLVSFTVTAEGDYNPKFGDQTVTTENGQWSFVLNEAIIPTDIIAVHLVFVDFTHDTVIIPVEENIYDDIIIHQVLSEHNKVTGTAHANAAISLNFVSGRDQAMKETRADRLGSWSVDIPFKLQVGDEITARQKMPDGNTRQTTVIVLEKSRPVTLSPYTDGDTALTGTGIAQGQVTALFPSGHEQKRPVADDHTFSISIPRNTEGIIYLTQSEKDKGESDPIAIEVTQPVYPPEETIGGNSGLDYGSYSPTPDRDDGLSHAAYTWGQLKIYYINTNGELLYYEEDRYKTGSIVILSAPDLPGFIYEGDDSEIILEISKTPHEVIFVYRQEDPAAIFLPSHNEGEGARYGNPSVGTGYINSPSGGVFGPDQTISMAEAVEMLLDLQATGGNTENGFAQQWYLNAAAFMNTHHGNTVNLNRQITRSEFIVLLSFYQNMPAGGPSYFMDIPGDYWADGFIGAARSRGYICGYTDESFRPDNLITRAEAVSILNRASGRTVAVIANAENPFVDLNQNHWAYWDILSAVSTGVTD